MSDLPTTIYVPVCEDDNVFLEDDSVTSDDDDLSLTREIVRSHCRAAPEIRRAPPRTVSLESSRQGPPRRTFSTSSESFQRRAPHRTVSSDSFRTPVHLMASMTLVDASHPRRVSSSCRMVPSSPRQVVSPSQVPREITFEEQTQPSASAINPLDVMYKEGLKKLARSMKHSDMTRNMIKRQSKMSKYSYRRSGSGGVISQPAGSLSPSIPPPSTPLYLHKQKEFFLSSRCEEVEHCRRQLFDMIQETQGV